MAILDMKALFLAGGTGTRLWPLSRASKPKQLHTLVGDKSLMTQTIERVRDIVDRKDVWIITAERYLQQIAEQCPGVPKSQFITEPFPLGTGLAIGLGLIHLSPKHSDAVVLLGWADSYVGNVEIFTAALKQAEQLVSLVEGVMLVVPPTYPAKCYGYIETGEPLGGDLGASAIVKFEEKPSYKRAKELVETGKHFWNSGFSVWRVSALLDLMREHMPDHFDALQKFAPTIGTDREQAQMRDSFSGLEPISIDRAIFEKATGLAAIPVAMGWSDIGSWGALYDVRKTNDETLTRGAVVTVDTDNCLILSEGRLIATLGISDLVIIETDDAILVVHKDQTERLKELYEKVEKFGGDKYL